MDPRVAPLAEILRLNTVLFRNCLDSLSDEQAAKRPSAATNSAAFIAAHLASSRFYLLKTLGVDEGDPLAPYLDGRKGIDEIVRTASAARSRGRVDEGRAPAARSSRRADRRQTWTRPRASSFRWRTARFWAR